ncbi:SDR family NAD(P)-dependent oxidoreductase [Acidobacterium sp. S8]|uniref:SDR family NAD(P)-dependent oxidoreductase n=1 Tax=Acidobacterium sp. S8 TaxID=1641854 RepID=UPI00131B1ABD|nr:SDR family oxidoreductase [Acidobacterium sp. S8]
MDLGLKGKRALVTGSTAGIGFAIARLLAREGASVYVNGRTEARVEKAVAEIEGKVDGIAADLTTPEGAQKLFERVKDVDIVVNNLGIFEAKPFLEIEDSEWVRFFEANVLSGIRVTRHYLPPMLERKWGRILFISSESAIQIPAEMVHYGMTKTAQIAIARGIAESFPASGVTVNSVLVGPTESEGVSAFVDGLASQQKKSREDVERDFFQHMRPTSLIKRFETPDEVAAMVGFLCSEAASAITGSAQRVDGGVVKAIV